MRNQNPSANPPATLLQQALKFTPAIKYAVAVAAIAGLIATALRYGLSAATLVLGVIVVVGLMVLFFAFSQLEQADKRAKSVAGMVVLWSFLLLCIGSAALLFSSAFFNWPLPLRAAVLGSRAEDASASKSHGVEPGIIGTWECSTEEFGAPVRIVFVITPDGTFDKHLSSNERGTFVASGGKWKQVNKMGVVKEGDYTFVDPDTVTLQNPQYAYTFKRRGDGASDASANPFVGKWDATTYANVTPFVLHTQIFTDNTYEGSLEAREVGTISAADGKWSGLSSRGVPLAGTYRCAGESLDINIVPFGLLTMRRVTETGSGR